MRAVLVMTVALAACGGGDAGDDADAGSSADAAPIECADTTSLQIGACTAQGDAPCTSTSDTDPRFEPLADSAVVRPVVGFQGSTMFALALRAEDITPGIIDMPQTQPIIEVSLADASDVELTNYFRTNAFEPVSGQASLYEWLFVFLQRPRSLHLPDRIRVRRADDGRQVLLPVDVRVPRLPGRGRAGSTRRLQPGRHRKHVLQFTRARRVRAMTVPLVRRPSYSDPMRSLTSDTIS